MAKRGRPSIFTEKLAETICTRIAGGESLRRVCRDEGMPATSTVMLWALSNEKFSEQYRRARAMLMDTWSEDIVEISDDATNDYMDRLNADGDVVGEVVNSEHIQRSKLRVDTRKWLMSRLAPKKYGDRMITELTGKDGGPMQFKDVSAMTDDAIDAELRQILGGINAANVQAPEGEQ